MPKVSVIIPCYNEEKTIGMLLESLNNQSFPNNELEVIIADGHSSDRTRDEIEKFFRVHPDLDVAVIDNPQRSIPKALNLAIAASSGEILIRLDAHSVPNREYIELCVQGLEEGKGDNVGGVWDIIAGNGSWIARSIALAAAHPLGVGDAKYRYTDVEESVDTVPYGAFYRTLIDRIGGYDESLLSNEDYEFNTRIRTNGGKIWLNPRIRATYYARASITELARQYWRYGFWKIHMLHKYPGTIRWRQVIPPTFVFSLIFLSLLSFYHPVFLWILGLEVVSYAGMLAAVGLQAVVRKKDLMNLVGVPLAIATMHIFWGGAFLWSGLMSLANRSPSNN